jgi:hypothetical protein
MSPVDEFSDILDRLLAQLRARAPLPSQQQRHAIRSFVGAWFQLYRPAFLGMLGDQEAVKPVDDSMQSLTRLVATGEGRRRITTELAQLKRTFSEHLVVPLTRSYWSRAPERTPAGLDEEVLKRLTKLDVQLANGYEQVILDLEDKNRISYRGTAGELREVLTGVLHRLAPTAQVEATEWYRESRRSGTRKDPTPTRSERVRFILRARNTGSAQTDAAETYVESVEERLGLVVNATYARQSVAAHRGAELGEVAQLLRYANALLREVLPT